MRRRLAGGAVLALTAALTTACPSPAEERPDDRHHLGPGDVYVALGDSYTAGTLTGPPQQPVDGCGRSTTNYPNRIARELRVDLVDASCNGASTRELTGTQDRQGFTAPPQLDAVDDDTDLVTISLGGNDFYSLARITHCAAQFAGRDGAPCTRLDDAAGPSSVSAQVPMVEDNVAAALREIRDRAPDARIIVIGYPQLFPSEGTCDRVPLPRQDYAWARSVVDGLNQALSAAAEREDVSYVDVAGPSEGHDICSDDPWVAGAQVTRPARTTPWHPYPVEGKAVADLVLAELEQDR